MEYPILRKPVHPAVKSGGKVPEVQTPGLPSFPAPELPTVVREPVNPFKLRVGIGDIRSIDRAVSRLRVMHASIPPLTGDRVAPCDTCETSACCIAYNVTLTKEEYDSGLYAPHAIKITNEAALQLRRTMFMVRTDEQDDAVYVLEGNIGEPCPFLLDNGQCGIYEDRPLVCRSYTCVEDPRIDDEVRAGEKPVMY